MIVLPEGTGGVGLHEAGRDLNLPVGVTSRLI